ncbi:MAG TPA: dTDP-4-dehydrorhamnose reductase [Methylovirgula sp.]
MLRIGVTGRTGQVAQTLRERGPIASVEIVVLARPHADLLDADSIARAIEAAGCDVIVNAAAYTNVERAEAEPDLAMAINADGARHVAMAAKAVGIPVIQISTDYVFDGEAARPYREDDVPAPLGAYGRSKLAGERAVAETHANHVILRTAWIYSATGHNFVRRMLQLAETRSFVGVVADQIGCPTYAPDLADVIVAIAAQHVVKTGTAALRGIFHAAGTGGTSRAELARAIFAGSARRGCAPVRVDEIATADYPAPVQRPANSRLDAHKLAMLYRLQLPDWRQSLETCLDRLLAPVLAPDRDASLRHESPLREGR